MASNAVRMSIVINSSILCVKSILCAGLFLVYATQKVLWEIS